MFPVHLNAHKFAADFHKLGGFFCLHVWMCLNMLIYCVIWSLCFASHVCIYACVHVLIHVYLCFVAMHTFLAGQRGADEQTANEGGLAWRLCTPVCAYFCLCVCVRVQKCEVITKVYFMSCFGPPSVCFVYLGGHNSFGWLDCVSKMCSLPPARHINHCLPCWLTLHHTNPSPKTTLATLKKYPTKYFFTRTIRHFATPWIFTKSIYSVVFQ